MTSVGVPIKILHEAEGHVVTLETVTGLFTKFLGIKLPILSIVCVKREKIQLLNATALTESP